MIIPKRIVDRLRRAKVRPSEVYIAKVAYWFVLGLMFAVGAMALDERIWPLLAIWPVAGILAYSVYKTDSKEGYVDAMYDTYIKNRQLDALENSHKAAQSQKTGH